MRDQPSQDRMLDPGEHELRVDRALVALLVDRHPAIVSLADVRAVVVAAPRSATVTELDLADAEARLIAAGLAHRVDDRFLLASSAAIRAAQLFGL